MLDPFWLVCCALYAVNRWGVKPHFPGSFFHCWMDDLLLIPCALPLMLQMHRSLGLRAHGGPPSGVEILAHLAGWSVLFEFAGPRYLGLGTADPLDVVVYAAGAVLAAVYWRHRAPVGSGAVPAVASAPVC